MKILSFENLLDGVFIERRNRFLGIVQMGNRYVEVAVRDSGRLEELLFKGNKVKIIPSKKSGRKTEYDLLSAYSDAGFVLVNSSLHRDIFQRILDEGLLFSGDKVISKPEVKVRGSRLDFFVEVGDRKIWIETKGCTLARNRIALFPDAPTLRGKRHVEELIELKREGYESMIVFLVFRSDAEVFSPNFETDPEFSHAFISAIKEGIKVFCPVFGFEGDSLYYLRNIPMVRI